MMEASERTVEALIRATHWTERVETLIVVACLPALAEEWLFRGVLQTELLKTRMSPSLALVFSALLFSLFHLQPFHLLPLFAFGLLLGWVRWTSGNLWYSVVLHFANNALVLFAMWYPDKLPATETVLPLVAAALFAAALGLLWVFRRMLHGAEN
jgi:membrane protease YdiL (CAAX protease family)